MYFVSWIVVGLVAGWFGGTTFVAIIGAVLLTLLAGFVNGRRMYARQL
jgi:uncharacterized membrane protein YeaQ/YmgE (transglycosylase-associated protein family)